jgi:hypothetical protein
VTEETSDSPPDRLSLNPKSQHFKPDLLQRGVRILFKGKERNDVEEYCVSEGWIRVAAGRSLDRYGQPMTVKLKGEVEPFYRDSEAAEASAAADPAAAEGGSTGVGGG